MLKYLTNTNDFSRSNVGTRVFNLHLIYSGGISLVPSFIIDTTPFGHFLQFDNLPPALIDNIHDVVRENEDFSNCRSFLISSSTPSDYPGLTRQIEVESSVTSVQYGIETIYRSWSSDRAVASRVVYGVRDEDSIPRIVIQPSFENTVTLCTRTCDGSVTRQDNFTRTIKNSCESFAPHYSGLLAKAERALGRPSIIKFVEDSDLRIISAQFDELPDLAYWRSISELSRCGVISPVDYLMSVSPTMLVEFQDYQFADPDAVSIPNGLPASPGMNIGQIVLAHSPTYDESRVGERVLAIKEIHPPDMDAVAKCAAVITCTGGMTSHAAVACRGLLKPLVISQEISIDAVIDQIRHERSGGVFNSSWFASVNGSSGTISFSKSMDVSPSYTIHNTARPYLDDVLSALKVCEDMKLFRSLSLAQQQHLSGLRGELRKVGLVE